MRVYNLFLCIFLKSQILKMFCIKYSDFNFFFSYVCTYVSVPVSMVVRRGGQIPCAWSCELPSVDVGNQTPGLSKVSRSWLALSHLSSPQVAKSNEILQSISKATLRSIAGGVSPFATIACTFCLPFTFLQQSVRTVTEFPRAVPFLW